MQVNEIKGVIGTNGWGGPFYETLLRGSAVGEETLKAAAAKAAQLDMAVFDTARDYGLGKCQPMLGAFCDQSAVISAKYTPMRGGYTTGQVRRSLEKDLLELRRESVDIYWLHLPNAYEANLREMVALYREGKIKHIGVSNFNLEECRGAKALLAAEGIPLYGVQNHYSLINRDWETNGLVAWCRENGAAFWAWAVLEEGLLAGPKRREENWTLMKGIFAKKRKRLACLFALMREIGRPRRLSIAQVAMAYPAAKGIVPICGCRRPEQVQQLFQAVNTPLEDGERRALEQLADRLKVRVFGKDIFRFAVRQQR